MKKFLMAFVVSIALLMICVPVNTAFAAEETTFYLNDGDYDLNNDGTVDIYDLSLLKRLCATHNIFCGSIHIKRLQNELHGIPKSSRVAREIDSFSEPYLGRRASDFDLNGDDEISVIDLALLKRLLNNGDKRVSRSTINKLQSWLHGKPGTLEIKNFEYKVYTNQSEDTYEDSCYNFFSKDYKFIGAQKMTVYTGSVSLDNEPISLCFLNDEEDTIYYVTFFNFCHQNQLDEVIFENEKFVVGLKNGRYNLATRSQIFPFVK